MTLEQLRHFAAAAEAGSFSRAAELLFVSHSTISRSVQALEREFGVVLFVRGDRTLARTEAGDILLEEARALLRRADGIPGRLADLRSGGELRLISVGIYAPALFDLFRRFQQEHPALTLRMEQASQLEILERLRRGECDLTVTFSYSWPGGEELDALTLETGRFCALVSPHHPLAQKPFLTAQELATSPDVLGENPFHQPKEHTTPPPVDNLERTMTSILLQVKTGGGVAILPEHAAAEYGQSCLLLPIRGEGTEYQLLLGWRRGGRNPAVGQAVDFFRRALQAAPLGFPRKV